MTNPPALLTRKPEADNNFENKPSVMSGGPITIGGSITNFQESTLHAPKPAEDLLHLTQTIDTAADITPLEVLRDAALEAIGAK